MHTPGPWEFEWHGEGTAPVVFAVDQTEITNGVDICEICWANQSTQESLANARLICAAPALLETLRHLIKAAVPNADPIVMFACVERARAVLDQIEGVRR